MKALLSCVVIAFLAIPASGVAQTPDAVVSRQTRWGDVATAIAAGTPITALKLTGDAVIGNNLITGQRLPESSASKFSILALLPDRYSRVTDSQFFLRLDGFAGQTSLLATTFKAGASGSTNPQPSADYIAEQRLVAARLLLGGFGIINGPMVLSPVLQEAGTFRVTGDPGFDCLLDIGPDGYPRNYGYSRQGRFYTVDPGRPAAIRVEPSEWIMEFLDRREVSGVQVPHRILVSSRSLSSNSTTFVEELRVRAAEVNPQLSQADFK